MFKKKTQATSDATSSLPYCCCLSFFYDTCLSLSFCCYIYADLITSSFYRSWFFSLCCCYSILLTVGDGDGFTSLFHSCETQQKNGMLIKKKFTSKKSSGYVIRGGAMLFEIIIKSVTLTQKGFAHVERSRDGMWMSEISLLKNANDYSKKIYQLEFCRMSLTPQVVYNNRQSQVHHFHTSWKTYLGMIVWMFLCFSHTIHRNNRAKFIFHDNGAESSWG